MHSFNPELQLQDTAFSIRNKLIDLLTELKGFKFVTKLVFELKKIENDFKTKYSNFYSNSKRETIVNQSDINDVFESICSTIISNILKSLRKSSRWIADSVIGRNINVSKYNALADSSYIKLPKKLKMID